MLTVIWLGSVVAAALVVGLANGCEADTLARAGSAALFWLLLFPGAEASLMILAVAENSVPFLYSALTSTPTVAAGFLAIGSVGITYLTWLVLLPALYRALRRCNERLDAQLWQRIEGRG